MTQTFDLKNMGFAEMQHEELQVVDGGLQQYPDYYLEPLSWWYGAAASSGAHVAASLF